MIFRDMVLRAMVLRAMVLRDMVLRDMVLQDMVLRDMVLRDMVLQDMVLRHGIARHGIARHGIARHGIARHGIARHDEPGVFIGKIQPNNPTRAFLGYVDEKEHVDVTGDILESDELGYLYFKDRTGDTFRWKGENVSTSEVEAVISNVANYRDTVVYGVECSREYLRDICVQCSREYLKDIVYTAHCSREYLRDIVLQCSREYLRDIVYSAHVQGMEGRAGMVAILDPDESLNLRNLAESIKKCLPSYARPLFVRALQRVDVTGTYKLKKKELQNEGFDPTVIKDRLYYLSPSGTYELLTEDVYNQIFSGKIRL
uniref:Uncharacterized protein n=1 Tax=Timema douglasi TaxID=61478 RepID=A0A7R8ZGZ3_TIMDO|nr:unnamed protein product [Timema douglasi]